MGRYQILSELLDRSHTIDQPLEELFCAFGRLAMK